ncbi:MAG: oligosaccharide flippase family protein [Ignavibacterium sp.]|nr:oligosaccharide flippase family protein [Ignavibacterium sp.]
MYDFQTVKNKIFNSKLVNDSFWAIFGNIIAKGLALAAGIIVARLLGKEIFGEYGIIKNTLMSVAIFSTFGLGYTATKFVAEYKNSKPEYIKEILRYSRNITLSVSGVMATGLFITAGYIAEKILEAPHLTISLRLVAIWIVFNAVTTMQIGVLAGFSEFKGMARINTVIGLFTFIASLVLTYFYHLNGALIALLLTQILNWYLNYRLVEKNLSSGYNIEAKDRLILKKMLKFSLPVALQEILYPITSWLTSLILIRLSNYGELGLYAAAMQWNAIILYVPGILRNVILAHLAESSKKEVQHDRIMRLTLLLSFVLTLIPFLFVFSFSNFITSFYGISFTGLNAVINIAVFTTIFTSLSNVYTQAYLSKGMNWIMFTFRVFRDAGIVLITFLLLKNSDGQLGAIAATYSSLFMNIIFLIIIALFYNFNKQKNDQIA